MDKVDTHLRTILNVNQWRNTQNVIEWFGNIEQKSRHSFISFDIVDFYPSISENLLDQARLADKTRKELHKALKQLGLKITAESNLHVVNFLDVTFDLSTGKYKPYRKPNDDPLYIILRQLPTSINKRISTLSSDKQTFEDAAPAYQNALGQSNFSHKLEYTPHGTQRPRRNRQRIVIWFNPPFSKNVKTNHR